MNCSVADASVDMTGDVPDTEVDPLPAPPRHLPFRPPKGKNSNTKNLSLLVPQAPAAPAPLTATTDTFKSTHSLAAIPFVPFSSQPPRRSTPSPRTTPGSPHMTPKFSPLSRSGSVKRSHVDAEPEESYDRDYRGDHKNHHSRTSPKRLSPGPANAAPLLPSLPPMEPPPFSMQRRTSQLSISIPLTTTAFSMSLAPPLGTPTSNSGSSASSAVSQQLSLSDSESDPNSDNTTHTTPPPNYDDDAPHTISKHHLFSETLITPSVHHENAYPDGPLLIYPPNVYLYSEPSVEMARSFDVVINVAKEIDNPFADLSEEQLQMDGPAPEYVYVPWGHNSKFLPDLPYLTNLIDERSAENKRVLVHCQCGVSRSASLLIAYIMKKQRLDLNAAYDWVKYRSPEIGPNMTLIFQLMDWHKHLIGEKPELDSDED